MNGAHLGVDVGGTKVAVRLESADGSVVHEDAFTWAAGADVAVDVAMLARGARALATRWDGSIGGIGVAMPATVDAAGRVTAWPNRPSWVGLDLTAALAGLVPGAPVAHADDGDLAALAEAAAAGVDDLLYLGVGTGIGGGIIHGGRIWPGPDRGSCEIGHLVVALDGPVCGCGRRGCVQAIASGPATLRRAGAYRSGADAGPVEYAELRDGWLEGTPWATAALAESARALATAIAGIGELAHPALAVVGGGFADGLAGFADAVAAATADLTRPGHPTPAVEPARLGGLSSLRGALELARRLGAAASRLQPRLD